ncbi:MAG: ATP-binding protein [Candidatus Omnitrophota bacterium]
MFIEPVFGKKFFGREEVLATLHKRVTALKGGYRQNLALTGPMLGGKSSILRHFLKNIKDPDIIPLYIEMAGEDFQVFCTRFCGTLLYQYLRSSGQKADGDFDALKKACHGMIPETMRCITKVCKALKQKKEECAYENLLALTSVFKTETGKSCIVILDEFHNLSNFRLKRPFQIFGKFIMVQKNTMYIVSSSQKTLLKDILSRKLSLLFGNFEVLEINGFDNQTARSFISDKINDLDFREDIQNYLIQVSQGSPFYLEVLASRFSELIKRKDSQHDAKECLLNAFAELLYESNGVLNQYFTNNINFFLEKSSRKKFIPILICLARGKSTIKAVQDDLGRADKELGSKLQKLQDMDLVCKSGIFYKISDKLFEYWLKYVYSLKTQSMIDDMDIKYLEFKRCIEEDYRGYLEFSAKDAVTVISDLFKSFRDEKVRINMNDRKMPHFDLVESQAVSGNVFQVTGSVQNKKWVCHVKQNDIADEHDVYGLWEVKAEDESSKITRKIFIPLKGIEQNAFLLAKEQNIWVWDARQLNEIFRLFGKFELVL